MATRPGLRSRPERATIVQSFAKSHEVLFQDGTKMKLASKKVKPLGQPQCKPIARKPKRMPARMPAISGDVLVTFDATRPGEPKITATLVKKDGVAIPKPLPPEESPAFLEMVRGLRCCNCKKPPRSEAHHEGKKGVSQKVRDTLAVPLCNRCHRIYTDFNELPRPGSTDSKERLSRGESLRILRGAQAECLKMVLERIEAKAPDLFCELVSAMLGRMDQAQLTNIMGSWLLRGT